MKKGLSSFDLKFIAIIAMVIDHMGIVFFPEQMWLRIIGRISFPIFAFLLVEGIYYTHNMRRYLLRLGLLALISEIPYDIALRDTLIDTEFQNVFFTLFLGVLAVALARKSQDIRMRMLIYFSALIVGWALEVDYSWIGVLFILLLWKCRDKGFPLLLFVFVIVNLLIWGEMQIYAMLALIPIALYNGTEGKKCQWLFYSFYPVHLFALYLINQFI